MPRGVPNGNADIRAIRQSLHTIVDTLVRLLEIAQNGASRRLAAVSPATQAASRKSQTPRPRLRLSRGRRAALRLQGEYMGRLRGLAPANKVRVKALRAKKGFPAAIKLAARLAT